MANDPKDILDEQEIVRRRDDVADDASDEPLSTASRRALATARLQALAFALGNEQGQRRENVEIDDSRRLKATSRSRPHACWSQLVPASSPPLADNPWLWEHSLRVYCWLRLSIAGRSK
jgi:hypothetical protein